MSQIIAGQTLVSLLYPNKEGVLVQRKGRVEKIGKNFLVVFVGNGEFRTFQENKISNLTIIGG